jgi:hypothetical protein
MRLQRTNIARIRRNIVRSIFYDRGAVLTFLHFFVAVAASKHKLIPLLLTPFLILSMTIGWMIDAIIGRNVLKFKGINSLQTGHIVAILLRVGAALVMRINASVSVEIMLGGECIELV